MKRESKYSCYGMRDDRRHIYSFISVSSVVNTYTMMLEILIFY